MRTEKDKMLAGELYDANAPEVQAELAATHKWLARNNASLDMAPSERRQLLAERVAAVGERSMPRLTGKVAFITGAGSGIGRAAAILFAAEGAKLAIAEIDARAGEETAHLAGNGAIAIHADVTDPDSLQAVIRTTVDKFGRLDVLHNNAGGSTARDDTAVDAPLDEFWRAIKLDDRAR